MRSSPSRSQRAIHSSAASATVIEAESGVCAPAATSVRALAWKASASRLVGNWRCRRIIVPNWYRIIAHCAAKQISATVATDRPTTTLDSHVSNKQIR